MEIHRHMVGHEGRLRGDLAINASVSKEIAAAADKIKAGWLDGSYDVFSGPIADQSGAEKVAKGAKLDDGALSGMDWFVKGVEGA